MARLTFAEQETTITWSRASDVARIYTHDRALVTAIEKRKIKPMQEHVHGGQVVAKSYEAPKDWVSVRPKGRRSESQRAAARQSIAKARQAQETRQTASVSAHNAPDTGSSPSSTRRASR